MINRKPLSVQHHGIDRAVEKARLPWLGDTSAIALAVGPTDAAQYASTPDVRYSRLFRGLLRSALQVSKDFHISAVGRESVKLLIPLPDFTFA